MKITATRQQLIGLWRGRAKALRERIAKTKVHQNRKTEMLEVVLALEGCAADLEMWEERLETETETNGK